MRAQTFFTLLPLLYFGVRVSVCLATFMLVMSILSHIPATAVRWEVVLLRGVAVVQQPWTPGSRRRLLRRRLRQPLRILFRHLSPYSKL